MYEEAPDIKEIAEQLINSIEDLNHIDLLDIKVGYLYSDNEKKQRGNKVFADITQVAGLLSYYCDYHFIVTVYEPNVIDLTDAQIQVLIYHELLHIDSEGKLRGHDVQDFYTILDRYGLDWSNDDSLPLLVGGEKRGNIKAKAKGNNKTGGRKQGRK